ncbi:unnamed protein product [Parnassius mnemosyne]|uniref:Pentraxin (PTX) domain-containing protein n=1 Tax=Parnassius mnemosyne TaxID=213953 RepID=A0AAV1L0X8_9NEOP
MSISFVVAALSIIASSYCINRPVYKIVLTQKGFSQFIQYDIDTPPIREFTFCAWIRFYDLDNEQGLFSYVVNGNRIIRLWLDSGGQFMKVSINEKVATKFSVDIVRDVWKHICLSYQSDYGAWALYIDGRLVTCETMQSLFGFILPGGGSVIIGYGTSHVIPSGLEGEVFGVNMILSSTIERNHTLKRDPLYEQKRFLQNRVIGNKNLKYIVLGEMDSYEIKNNFETTKPPSSPKTTKYYIHFALPYSFAENNIHFDNISSSPKSAIESNEREIMDFSMVDPTLTTDKSKINFWSLLHQVGKEEKIKGYPKNNMEVERDASTSNLFTTTIPIWETSPTALLKRGNYKSVKPKNQKFPSLYELGANFNKLNVSLNNKPNKGILTDTPFVPPDNESNMYGQWTSSKYAGSVLNYLKKINYRNREPIKVPANVPLVKISDNFEHLTDFKGSKVHTPLKFQRRNFEDKQFDKRDVEDSRKINKIIEKNIQMKKNYNNTSSHTDLTRTNVTKKFNAYHRFYRDTDSQTSSEYKLSAGIYKPKLFTKSPNNKFTKTSFNSEGNEKSNILTILPFIKSAEYLMDDSSNVNSNEIKNNDMFARSLPQGNKWHNVQTYNNDFTPRRLNLEIEGSKKNTHISEANKKLPSVRLKYKPDLRKFMTSTKDVTIMEGRALAKQVSNQSNNHDSISIRKYNRGFLPKQKSRSKSSDKINQASKTNLKQSFSKGKDDFNKEVTLRNLINEQSMVSLKTEQNHQTNLEGDDKAQEIYHFRSDNRGKKLKARPALKLNVCKNIELNDNVLYAQPDGSIDRTRIVSPVKDINIGIEFIMQNYKRCSLQDSALEKNPFLFIDWNKTPVRLFGGAYPKKTTDLCGFF